MIGASMGLAARGGIPFPSTFACFLSRAYDFIRMAAISQVGIKMAGSHAGVSIGEDGPSQMALEDLAMCRAEPNITVLYPCDGVSTERLVALAAYHPGPAYIRTSRPKTPVIYSNEEQFAVGGSKVLRESANDAATVVGAGVTVFEAPKAYDPWRAESPLGRRRESHPFILLVVSLSNHEGTRSSFDKVRTSAWIYSLSALLVACGTLACGTRAPKRDADLNVLLITIDT